MYKPCALYDHMSSVKGGLDSLYYLHWTTESPKGSPNDNQSSLVAEPMQPPSNYNFCTASMHKCLALPSAFTHIKETGINELLEGQAGTSSAGAKPHGEKQTNYNRLKQR